MKGIIVHEIYTKEPIFIKIKAINAVEKIVCEEDEWSKISLGYFTFAVNEDFDTIMQKIKEAENESED